MLFTVTVFSAAAQTSPASDAAAAVPSPKLKLSGGADIRFRYDYKDSAPGANGIISDGSRSAYFDAARASVHLSEKKYA